MGSQTNLWYLNFAVSWPPTFFIVSDFTCNLFSNFTAQWPFNCQTQSYSVFTLMISFWAKQLKSVRALLSFATSLWKFVFHMKKCVGPLKTKKIVITIFLTPECNYDHGDCCKTEVNHQYCEICACSHGVFSIVFLTFTVPAPINGAASIQKLSLVPIDPNILLYAFTCF